MYMCVSTHTHTYMLLLLMCRYASSTHKPPYKSSPDFANPDDIFLHKREILHICTNHHQNS